MSHFLTMNIGKRLSIVLIAASLAVVFAATADAGTILVNGTPGFKTLYSFNPKQASVYPFGQAAAVAQLSQDATLNGIAWGSDPNYQSGTEQAWLQTQEAATPSTITWQLQAASGYTIASDVTVKWNIDYWDPRTNDTSSDTLKAQWSNDGTDWTYFVDVSGAPGLRAASSGLTALLASGYNGGSNLYLRFTVYRAAVSNGSDVQLFTTPDVVNAPFIVSGSVIPEPSTVIFLGGSLLSLLAYAWRKPRKN